tara:strand:- start:335 stop:1777 length:1443 start_codon:yes stop_codon:yes gene_type:complete
LENKIWKMKIILLNPPYNEEEMSGKTSLKRVSNVIPPLGLAYLAAVLEKEGYKDIKIIDCLLGLEHNKLIKILQEEKPDILGMMTTSTTFYSVVNVAKDVRKLLPKTVIVIGGPHVTSLPEEAMKHGDLFDVGITGEGEITLLEIVKTIDKKGWPTDLEEVDGLVYKKEDKIVFTNPRKYIENLDDIPHPARHLLPPLKNYHPTAASYRKLPYAVMITSRGCPSLCTFCDRSIFGVIYREYSAEYVLEEIDELINKYGVREIRFFDDTFTLNKRRLFKICDGLKKYNLSWTCLTKANLINEEMLRKMKEAGCWQVLYGLESGDERIMKLLKKGTTVEDNERAVELTHKVGLSVRADFIIGTPGETYESARKTVDFAKRMNMDFAHFNKFTPYPGTEIYNNLIEHGSKFNFDIPYSQLDHKHSIYVPESINLSEGEYGEFINGLYKEYYLRPQYIFKQIFGIRSFEDIKRLFNGFLAIIGL